jgi:hypothetical protein
MPTLARGCRVRVEGEWVMDKRFGAQLKARSNARARLHAAMDAMIRTRACLRRRLLGSRRLHRESAAGILGLLVAMGALLSSNLWAG